MIDQIREKYRNIRLEVYECSTKPLIPDTLRHDENKRLFRERVIALCNCANLANYTKADNVAKTALWNHLWTKNRFAGIRAQLAATEISQLSGLFDNYQWFSDSRWDIDAKGYRVNTVGEFARDFLERTGEFSNIQTIGNVPKLKKIVAIARDFKKYFDDNPNANALDFVTHGLDSDNVWGIHEQLTSMGYKGDLTTLHFMMDVGFQVIKPDLVISRLFLDWGWLRYAIPSLPSGIKREDLIGKGSYGSRYLYTKPRIYRPVIDLARTIVQGLDKNVLASDIGWSTSNPVREFDIFVVKAGQLPQKEFGLERRLYS